MTGLMFPLWLLKVKTGYWPGADLVKDEKGDGLLADSHNILNMWKNYFFQLLIEQGVNPLELNDSFK